MVSDSQGLHHLHVRERVHENLELYPHPNKWKNFMDRLIFFVGAVGPLMTIPQVMKIWVDKNAAGVSLISWTTYLVTEIIWIIYGIMHKEKPIIITYTMWVLLDIMIVVGIILYG